MTAAKTVLRVVFGVISVVVGVGFISTSVLSPGKTCSTAVSSSVPTTSQTICTTSPSLTIHTTLVVVGGLLIISGVFTIRSGIIDTPM